MPMTINQTADHLCKSRRWLLEWLRKHPADKDGQPYYTPVGRDKIFHQADIARIEHDAARAHHAGRVCQLGTAGRKDVCVYERQGGNLARAAFWAML
jgi:hypothetical protein